MRMRHIATIGVAVGLGLLGTAGAANATKDEPEPPPPPAPPTASATTECGVAHLAFTNPTPWLYTFDYRVDSEPLLDHDEFGPLWNVVHVDGRVGNHEGGATVTFEEDTGTHIVEYRVARGAESDLYDPEAWQKVTVESDCKEDPAPEPEPEPDPVPAAVIGDFACETGIPVTLDNTQYDKPTKFLVEVTDESGTTLSKPHVVDAGKTLAVSTVAVEDQTVHVRVAARGLVLAEADVSADCVTPPTKDPGDPPKDEDPKGPPADPPADKDTPPADPVSDEEPPATTPAPVANGGGTGGGPDGKVVEPVATEKLAYTGSTTPVALLASIGAGLVVAGSGAAWWFRKRHQA